MTSGGSSPPPARMASRPLLAARAHAVPFEPGAPRRGVQIARSPPCADELDDLADVLVAGELLFHVGETLLQGAFRAEQRAIGAAKLMDRLARKAAARQPDDVEAAELGAVADRRAERDDVVLHARHAADEPAFADADELVHGREPAEDRIVADAAMSAERRVIDQDDVVADLAVMRDMRADEDQAVVADPGQQPAALGAGIDRDVLADRAVLADLQPARLAVILLVLRRQADARERKDLAAFADRGFAADDDVRVDLYARAEPDASRSTIE